MTVGGRTSAYVEELQTLRNPGIRVKDAEEGSESDLPDLTDSDLEDPQSVQQAKRKVNSIFPLDCSPSLGRIATATSSYVSAFQEPGDLQARSWVKEAC